MSAHEHSPPPAPRIRILAAATLLAAVVLTLAFSLASTARSRVPTAAPLEPSSALTTATVRLVAPPLNKIGDGTIDVQVAISDATGAGAFEADLGHDGTLVTATDLAVDAFLGAGAGCDPDVERCATGLGPLDNATGDSVGAYTYGTGAGATGDGLLATLHVDPTGTSGNVSMTLANLVLTDVDANVLDASGVGTTFEVGTPGNCNDDPAVNAGDITALILEIFDADGSAVLDTRGSTFLGSPVGCDANEDSTVNAGDLTCIILIIFAGQGACG